MGTGHLSRHYSRKDVYDHPTDQHEFALEDEDDRLKTIDGGDHGDSDDGNGRFPDGDNNDEVHQLQAGGEVS